MLNIGPQELLLLLVIALIVVGPTRLPELGRSIGKGLREIRKAQDEVKRTIRDNIDEKPAPAGGPRAPAPGADHAADALSPLATPPDPTPLAGNPPAAETVSEISRTLGESLSELRRAREEVQRGFRVDLGGPAAAAPKRGPAASPPAPAEPPTASPPVDVAPDD